MTRVTLRQVCNHFTFCCSGHCGYGKKGQDVLCAAVSTLSQTLMETIRTAPAGTLGKVMAYSIQDGDVSVDLLTTDEGRARMRAAFETVESGFRLLEKKYKKFVAVGSNL